MHLYQLFFTESLFFCSTAPDHVTITQHPVTFPHDGRALTFINKDLKAQICRRHRIITLQVVVVSQDNALHIPPHSGNSSPGFSLGLDTQ